MGKDESIKDVAQVFCKSVHPLRDRKRIECSIQTNKGKLFDRNLDQIGLNSDTVVDSEGIVATGFLGSGTCRISNGIMLCERDKKKKGGK